MPQAVPRGLTREHVELAIAELDGGVPHPFGEPTGYELLFRGRAYAPKAVVGFACRFLIGRVLRPEEFSSGVAPGKAVHVLRELGFKVVKMAEDWTAEEVAAVVADYFDMLRQELLGTPFSKAEHRSRLKPRLQNRSDGSIEFKHQNISAVLVQRGLPYIDGYKPRSNYQGLLAAEVDAYLDDRADYFDALVQGRRLDPVAVPEASGAALDTLFVPPPDEIVIPTQAARPWLSRRGRKVDFARRDAENRRLGRLGEQWVVDVERRRLTVAGRDDLAGRVEWVANTCGDGLGFDVLSFDHEHGGERLIEVKTTGLGKYFPFLVTDNELRCSQDVPAQFHLYRVFSAGTSPRLYDLPGALDRWCELKPSFYTAYPTPQAANG